MPFIISQKGSNENDLMLHNRSALVKYLMKNGACPRSELAKAMNLTQASISKIVNNLIDEGVVLEKSSEKSPNGKRVIPVALNESGVQFIGIRITWTSALFGVFSLKGVCSHYETKDISLHDGYDDAIKLISDTINRLSFEYPNIISAGVSVPSPYVGKAGSILYTGPDGRDELISIAKEIRQSSNIPIYFKNDAKAGALAEWWFGNHDCSVLFHLLAGDLLHSSVIVNDEPIVGAYGIAGEIGENVVFDEERGTYAKLNECASASAFLDNFIRNIPDDSPWTEAADITLQMVFSAAGKGDAYASGRIARLGRFLGIALTGAINMLNPDVIVITDKLTAGGDLLLNEIKDTVKANVSSYVYDRIQIRFSTLSGAWLSAVQPGFVIEPSVLGAVAVAIDMYLQDAAKYIKRKNARMSYGT